MQTQTASPALGASAFKAAQTPRPPTLSVLARTALDDNDGNVEAATEFLVDTLVNDSALMRSTIRAIIEEAAGSIVRSTMHADRRAIISAFGTRSNSAGRAAVAALAAGITKSLLDFPLGDGTRLRDADKDAVLKQADLYQAVAKDQALKARWLFAIADAMGDAATVGDKIDEQRARSLFEAAQKETA